MGTPAHRAESESSERQEPGDIRDGKTRAQSQNSVILGLATGAAAKAEMAAQKHMHMWTCAIFCLGPYPCSPAPAKPSPVKGLDQVIAEATGRTPEWPVAKMKCFLTSSTLLLLTLQLRRGWHSGQLPPTQLFPLFQG